MNKVIAVVLGLLPLHDSAITLISARPQSTTKERHPVGVYTLDEATRQLRQVRELVSASEEVGFIRSAGAFVTVGLPGAPYSEMRVVDGSDPGKVHNISLAEMQSAGLYPTATALALDAQGLIWEVFRWFKTGSGDSYSAIRIEPDTPAQNRIQISASPSIQKHLTIIGSVKAEGITQWEGSGFYLNANENSLVFAPSQIVLNAFRPPVALLHRPVGIACLNREFLLVKELGAQAGINHALYFNETNSTAWTQLRIPGTSSTVKLFGEWLTISVDGPTQSERNQNGQLLFWNLRTKSHLQFRPPGMDNEVLSVSSGRALVRSDDRLYIGGLDDQTTSFKMSAQDAIVTTIHWAILN